MDHLPQTPAASLFSRRLLKAYLRNLAGTAGPVGQRLGEHRAMTWHRELDAELREALWSDPQRVFSSGVRFPSKRTVVDLHVGGRRYVLKYNHPRSLFFHLRHVGQPSRARRSWNSAWILLGCGIPTAQPLACLERYQKGGVLQDAYILMERVDGALLNEYVAQNLEDREKLAAVARRFSTILRTMHRLRAVHGDMKATNFVVGADGGISVIDLDAFRFFVWPGMYARQRRRDLRRFMANWAAWPAVAEVFREELRANAAVRAGSGNC